MCSVFSVSSCFQVSNTVWNKFRVPMIFGVVETRLFQPLSKYVRNALNAMNGPSIVSNFKFDHFATMLRSFSEHQDFRKIFRLFSGRPGGLIVSSLTGLGTTKNDNRDPCMASGNTSGYKPFPMKLASASLSKLVRLRVDRISMMSYMHDE